MRSVPLIILAYWFLTLIAYTDQAGQGRGGAEPASNREPLEDFKQVVVPIVSRNIYPIVKPEIGRNGVPFPKPGIARAEFYGSGFCLDPACSFIVTAYHVATKTRHSEIEKHKVVRSYFATGPEDKEATPNFLPPDIVLPFAKKRDLALLELEHPLSDHHGLGFYLDELRPGQEVDFYGYVRPARHNWRPFARSPAKFKAPTTSGLLAFDYDNNQTRAAGASGGIVVDRATHKIIGILCESSYAQGVAVPIQTLVEFVNKVRPFLAQKLFPTTEGGVVPMLSADLYPEWIPPQRESDQLKHRRPEESNYVHMLRQKAQYLADRIEDYVAVQSYAWGTGDRDPDVETAYEVRVLDGVQTFRSYPDGNKEYSEVPWPHTNAWTIPADEWSRLPKMIGTDRRLKVRQAADVVIKAGPIHVFQYYASVEDDACQFQPVEDYGIFIKSKVVTVSCWGEVWADEQMNIVRISQRLDLSGKAKAYRGWDANAVIVTYGWVQLNEGTDEPWHLVPLTIFTESRNGQVYWCKGQFTDYRAFRVGAKLLTN